MVYNTSHVEVWGASFIAVAPVKAYTGTILLPAVSVIDLLLVIALGKKPTSSLNTPSPNLFFLLFFTFYIQMSVAPSTIPRQLCFVLYKHQRQ